MKRRRRSKITVIALVFVFIVGTGYQVVYHGSKSTTLFDAPLHRTQSSGVLITESTTINVVDVTKPIVISADSFSLSNERFQCRMVTLANMAFPLCLYTVETDDIITAGLLLRDEYYEGDEVSRIIRVLRRDRRLHFVDIGANLGLFSLPAAHVTQVLAVEPNWRSMSRLAKAVYLGAVASNITLIHNAVSDVRTTRKMGVHLSNQGNAFLINSTKCRATPTNLPCNTLPPTRTILLNDLLPLMRSEKALLKVDVEGHEVNLFTNSTAARFFDHIKVPVVLMEWVLCKRHATEAVQRLLNFFYSRGYTAFDLSNYKVEEHYLRWPNSVVFKKSRLIRF